MPNAPSIIMKKPVLLWLSALLCFVPTATRSATNPPVYHAETRIVYAVVAGRELTLNAFVPAGVTAPVPAIVEIHGGWWYGGGAADRLQQVGGWLVFERHGLAVFSIEYRLGREGGFPENIRDCRNAVRFLRKNAARFHIDPDRLDVTGGSAGGHLSLMVAMVPEDFPDGGPTPGLENVSARVSGSFGFIPPTDFLRFWDQGPSDAATNADGQVTFRGPDNRIPDDCRPRFRVLFHGVTPETEAGRALYAAMSPISYARADVPPLLICDGEKDPIVPGLHGKALFEKLRATGANATYWMTPGGGHGYPGGPGFEPVLEQFLVRSLHLDAAENKP